MAKHFSKWVLHSCRHPVQNNGSQPVVTFTVDSSWSSAVVTFTFESSWSSAGKVNFLGVQFANEQFIKIPGSSESFNELVEQLKVKNLFNDDEN